MSAEMEAKIQEELVDGRLPCARAFLIAKQLKVRPRTVGEATDKMGIKIASCQLGCFP
ncbi:hypothetical protein ACFLTW_04770 [Chloroflexota bacterium]